MMRAARAAWFFPVSRWSAPSSDTKLRGCRAARKISLAFAMPTVLSVGECMTSRRTSRFDAFMNSTARTVSATLFENDPLPHSPSDSPKPRLPGRDLIAEIPLYI